MTATLRLEIQARAFQAMTGMMAPFKDEPAASSSSESHAKREAAYRGWRMNYGPVIDRILEAVDYFNQETDL